MAPRKRGTLSARIPSPKLRAALTDAALLSHRNGQHLLAPEALLLTFIRDAQGLTCRILTAFAQKQGFALADLKRELEDLVHAYAGRDSEMDFEDDNGNRTTLSDEMLTVLDDALTIARAMDELQVAPEHTLAAMSQKGVSTAGVLQRRGITPNAMSQVLQSTTLGRETITRDLVALAREGELTPLHYREALLHELINLLSLTRDRHVILVGPTGVGKRSLVASLAHWITEGRESASLDKVVQISESALLDAPDRAVRVGLRRTQGGILFLPDLDRFFGRTSRTDILKAAREVQQALLNDDPVIVGTTTEGDYDEKLAPDKVIVNRSHTLRVPEPDPEETLAILNVHRSQLESEYGIQIEPNSLETAVTMSKRYLGEAPLPKSALYLLHRACALVRTGTRDLAFHSHPPPSQRLDAEDVLLTINLMTGVPVDRLGADQRARYARMVEYIQQRIIGQDKAVRAVSRAIKTARVGLKDPKRPIGSFLFLGPTGVGKTELAKALAEFLFDDEDASVELDMSEYQNEASVNRLIGAPPGYVGYEGGGQLTNAVRQQPYVVVLFDEVEKAHRRVMDVLLQVMEEGRTTDGQGRTISFSETVVILTSNLGSEYLTESVASNSYHASDQVNRAALRKSPKPKLLIKLVWTLATRFDREELRTLCFHMGVDYDDLPTKGKANKARELVKYLERRNRIPELLEIGQRLRPDVLWDDMPETIREASFIFQNTSPGQLSTRKQVMDEVNMHFRPEFLNRLDEIILFHALSPDQLGLILDLMLKKEQRLLDARDLTLKVTEPARTWLLAQNEHPEWGARPLRRIIRKWVREPLADHLLKDDPAPGTTVRISTEANELIFGKLA